MARARTTDLLRRATALIPGDARSDAGCTLADVLDYLHYDEPELALGILEDFDGIAWQTGEFWDLLAESALRMESMLVLEPGRTAVVRLRPAEPWQHLSVGAVIAFHESQPMAGVATVIEYAGVGEARQRDR